MIIAFCGHSNFIKDYKYEKRLLSFLESYIGNKNACIYLGGIGGFDEFALECCQKYKTKHPNTSLFLITPYLTEEYQKNHLNYLKDRYDGIIYPEIENKPKRFAIVYRNRWMVEQADCIVSYISHNFGGAYDMYKYALRKNKEVFNIYLCKADFGDC